MNYNEALPDPEEDPGAGCTLRSVTGAASTLVSGDGGLTAVAVAADQGPAHQAQHGRLALPRHGVAAPEAGRQVHQICVVSGERDEASSPARVSGERGQGVNQLTAN